MTGGDHERAAAGAPSFDVVNGSGRSARLRSNRGAWRRVGQDRSASCLHPGFLWDMGPSLPPRLRAARIGAWPSVKQIALSQWAGQLQAVGRRLQKSDFEARGGRNSEKAWRDV